MVFCNSTLSSTHWEVDEVAGTLTFHQLGSIICGLLTIISVLVSFFLMYKHAANYTNPPEQRQILRILLMIPIYAITTMFSYVWYWHAVYWEVARDFYEAFAIAAFFALLCQYIAPNLHAQKEYFATLTLKPWPWPADWANKCFRGAIKVPRNGLTWFNIIWFSVFQYCFIRVATTIIATVTQVTGDYCEDSLHPAFAHLWMMFFNITSVTIAMYMLIAFYLNVSKYIAPHRPMLKLLCIKLVIFFSFWQMIVFDFLASAKIIKPSRIISQGDISIGFNALLICFEMTIFSVMHLWAFPWRQYAPKHASGTPESVMDPARKTAFRALVDTFNPFDMVKAFGRGMKWVLIGHRRRHIEAEKVAARRQLSMKSQNTSYKAPGAYPTADEDQYGLVPNAAAPGAASYDSLPVHPSPSQQIPIEEEPRYGIVETAHEGYRPSTILTPLDVSNHHNRPTYQPYSPGSISPIRPERSPVYAHPPPSSPGGVGYHAPSGPVGGEGGWQSPTRNTALPYPEVNAMPSISHGQGRANMGGWTQQTMQGGGGYDAVEMEEPRRGGGIRSVGGPEEVQGVRYGPGVGYGYSESLMDSEGVYQGPVERRREWDEYTDPDVARARDRGV